MNILIATDVFPPKSGGSGWSTFHLARALQQRGHRVEITLPKQGIQATHSRVYEGLNVVEVGYTATNVPGLRALERTRALEATWSAYLAERGRAFDLIHAQHILSIGAAVAAKKISHVPVVSTVREYWAVCLYGTLWRDDAICPICHGTEITRCLAQRYARAAQFMHPAVPLVEGELMRRQRTLQESDAVVAVSEFVASTLRAVTPNEKLHVIPNLIDPAETIALAQQHPPAKSETPYLMFIGKLNQLKGADWLPEILQKSGVEIPLVVAGEGEFKPKLTDCKGIDIRGWISNAETLGLLARAQALVFPSRWAEPLARTLLEAQALGVPTVACNTGGTRDIIEDNLNGLLAETVDDFAAHVRRVVHDPALQARLGANAKRAAQEKFSTGVVTAKLERLYQSVLDAPRQARPQPKTLESSSF